MFEHGNIRDKNASHPETQGWFLGDFIDRSSPFYHATCEAKWIERKAGEFHIGSNSSEPRKTICIMVDGHGEMEFPSHHQVIPLTGKGSYVVFDTAQCTHHFHALTDCTLLALRFKDSENPQNGQVQNLLNPNG